MCPTPQVGPLREKWHLNWYEQSLLRRLVDGGNPGKVKGANYGVFGGRFCCHFLNTVRIVDTLVQLLPKQSSNPGLRSLDHSSKPTRQLPLRRRRRFLAEFLAIWRKSDPRRRASRWKLRQWSWNPWASFTKPWALSEWSPCMLMFSSFTPSKC